MKKNEKTDYIELLKKQIENMEHTTPDIDDIDEYNNEKALYRHKLFIIEKLPDTIKRVNFEIVFNSAIYSAATEKGLCAFMVPCEDVYKEYMKTCSFDIPRQKTA